MCGIVGIVAFNDQARNQFQYLEAAVHTLDKRGPDYRDKIVYDHVALGHARLSIIDTSKAAHQPMMDSSGRYTIVYNGEIYNFPELKQDLLNKGIEFQTNSDTEVLLQLFIHEGREALSRLNGFFSFAIYDRQKDELFIARDRFGIKPLSVYQDENQLIFASELRAILAFAIDKSLDQASLLQYLQLSYIPAPSTILAKVIKILPGQWLSATPAGNVEAGSYYQLNEQLAGTQAIHDYEHAQQKVVELLEESVRKRMMSDVPLGAFLSGGIDSSAVVALASKHTHKLKTFSIGYKDEPFFDETYYANLVAKQFKTDHTVFSLANNDLYDHLFDILDSLDEPFADSSAIAVYILSKRTRENVTVALSGDGADELFAGYNKYAAEARARKGGIVEQSVKALHPFWQMFPKSRQNYFGNKVRQLERFASGMKLSAPERYWRWCSLMEEHEAKSLMSCNEKKCWEDYLHRKAALVAPIDGGSLNDLLRADLSLVLANDMLTKVDRMSMGNSLEVRVPFLDHKLVEYVSGLPADYKFKNGQTKAVLKDAFRNILPEELYTRPKQGFEVPLLKWFQNELRTYIEDEILSEEFITEQGLFDPTAISRLKKKLFSKNPGEIQGNIWSLIVFQHWWKRYIAE